MSDVVGVRELRTHLSEMVRRAEAGETVSVTVSGRIVAELGPPRRRRWSSRADAIRVLTGSQADPGRTDVLSDLAGDTPQPLP